VIKIRLFILIPILLILAGCGPSGPSEEEILKGKEEQIVNSWREFLLDREFLYNSVKQYPADKTLISGYITEDNRGIVVRYTELNFADRPKEAVTFMSEGLNIPDYIKEKILNTAPIDGTQEDRFDNLSITWDTDSDYDAGTIEIFIMLRLI